MKADPMTYLVRFIDGAYFKVNNSSVVLSPEPCGSPVHAAGSKEIVDEKRLKDLQAAGIKLEIESQLPMSALRAICIEFKKTPKDTVENVIKRVRKILTKQSTSGNLSP